MMIGDDVSNCIMGKNGVMGKWVIGNWKMNPATSAEAITLANALKAIDTKATKAVNVGCTPNFIHLAMVAQQLGGSSIWVGAQDVCGHTQAVGAFTGDVSAHQLSNVGVRFVLIGHSERRTYHHESNQVLSHKLTQALKADLAVVLCVGESQADYQAGHTLAVLDAQLAVLQDLDITAKQLLVAYEPVWAIGTGLTPSLSEIELAHRHIKNTLSAQDIKGACVLYGGSVNETNAVKFAQSQWIDGVLVGGASLKIDSFTTIITAFADTVG